MTAADVQGASAKAHAVVDADGRLLSADRRLDMLNTRAGGAVGRPLAIPQLAMLARLARRLGISMSRRVMVADEDADLDLVVHARADGERVRLTANDWIETSPWRPGEYVPALVPGDHGWRWNADAALRLTHIAPSAERLHGIDPEALLGRPLSALFGFGERNDGGMPILEALARRRPLKDQPATLKPNGRPVLLSAVIRLDQAGGFAGLEGEAQQVDGDGSAQDPGFTTDFIAGLNRALRAPLARIVADADSLRARKEGPLAPNYAEYASDIAGAGRHLLSLIDDLIDMQAIERPDFRPALEAIDLADVARRAAGLLAVRAERGGVALDRPGPQEWTPAAGDLRRTLQVLVNLVGNAVRYSPRGGRVLVESGMLDGTAFVAVADAGKGIAAEDQERIFGKFERVDPGEPGGNGLGLFIARRLARAMGGDVMVESAPGEGARFTLTLPAGQPPRDE